MERNATQILLLRKPAAQTPLPIQMSDRDDDFCFVTNTALEGDGVRESH